MIFQAGTPQCERPTPVRTINQENMKPNLAVEAKLDFQVLPEAGRVVVDDGFGITEGFKERIHLPMRKTSI